MNLSPEWKHYFQKNEFEALHWSEVGSHNAKDVEILGYAKENNFIVFTHDLDFSSILASTKADSPSVIQLRTQNTLPAKTQEIVIGFIKENQQILEDGALVLIDNIRARARILPIK